MGTFGASLLSPVGIVGEPKNLVSVQSDIGHLG